MADDEGDHAEIINSLRRKEVMKNGCDQTDRYAPE